MDLWTDRKTKGTREQQKDRIDKMGIRLGFRSVRLKDGRTDVLICIDMQKPSQC